MEHEDEAVRITDDQLDFLIKVINENGPYLIDGECATTAALRELQEARILLRALARSGHTARIVRVGTTVNP